MLSSFRAAPHTPNHLPLKGAYLKGVWSWLSSRASSLSPFLPPPPPPLLPPLLLGFSTTRSAMTARESPTLATYSMPSWSSAQQAVVPERESSRGEACSWELTATRAACRACSGADDSVGWLARMAGSCLVEVEGGAGERVEGGAPLQGGPTARS